MTSERERRPCLLVLASTYPRWAGDPEPGFVHELSRRLVDRFRVIVLCPHAAGAQPHEILDGVEVVRYRYAPQRWETLVNDGGIVTNLRRDARKYLLVPVFILAQVSTAARLIRREQVELIHAHWLVPQGLVATFLQWLPGPTVPFVVTSHGADLYAMKGRWLDNLKRLIAAKAAAVTVVSSAMCEHLSRMGADASKIQVRPMGVELLDRFAPDQTVRRSSHEILFVGRLVEKKGLSYLLRAMTYVLAKRPDATLLIAGFGPDRSDLEKQASELELDGSVRFLGSVPQEKLPGLYRRAAVFVAPFVQAPSGDQEGLGLVLVEAIGCGCPVVVGDVPAVFDILGAESHACTVDPRNSTELAGAILRVLENPQMGAQHVLRLREALVDRLDWNAVAGGYAGMLDDCLRARRADGSRE